MKRCIDCIYYDSGACACPVQTEYEMPRSKCGCEWWTKKRNYLELVDFFMDEYGMDEDAACRLADMETNQNYNADDYDMEV